MPPLLSEEEAAKQAQDPRYKHLQVKDLPQGETLKTTLDRVLPIWQDKIAVVTRRQERSSRGTRQFTSQLGEILTQPCEDRNLKI